MQSTSASSTQPPGRWLNRAVVWIGLASLFSDWAHEIAKAVMPALLATIGVGAAWLGLIEGVADRLSSFAKQGFFAVHVEICARLLIVNAK